MAYLISRLIPDCRLILLAVLAAFVGATVDPAGAQNDSRLALVIGNAAYPDADAPLKEPLNNIRSLTDELRRHGFEVETGENLSKEAMRAALERFYGKIKSGSTALLFFSGFGIQSDRQTYIIPVNAQIWTEPDVRRDGFSLDTVLAEMNSKGARVKIAILDASRRNPFERRFRAVAAGLAPVGVPKGTVVMYAAAPGAVVRDGDRQVFVSELIREIRAPGKIEEAFNRTLIGVSRESKGEQVPWFSSSLVEEFSFATTGRVSSNTTTPSVTERDRISPPPPPPPVSSDPDAAARNAYQSAERIGTKKAYEDFLYDYPSGRYADRARDQIARLSPSPARPSPPPPVSSDPDAAARNAYQSAERIGTKKAYEDFLYDYPSGRYAERARDQIARLSPSSPAPAPAPPPVSRIDDPAITELDRKIRANPNDGAAYYKRGQLYAQHGDYTSAVRDFDDVVRLNPKDAEAFNNRCWARAMIGELQSALRDCDQALDIRPRYVDALDSRGFVNLKMEQRHRRLRRCAAVNPKHASALYGRGIAKRRSGNTTGGNGDISAAKLIQSDIADEFATYGIR
jgi:tetratricopeptide (TPR) repeat protein